MDSLNLEQVWQLAGEGYLRSHIGLGLDTAGGPPVYHLGAALTLLSVALCHEDSVYSSFLDPMLPLYPHLYRISLGPTGIGKTRAERLAQRVLANALPGAFLPGDFSREGLYDKLAQQPYGYLSVDEFRGLQERLSRDYNAGAKEFLTEAYDSPPLIKRKLKTAEAEIRSPRINLVAGTTIEWFEKAIRDGDFEGGWLPRFLFLSASEIQPLRRPGVQRQDEILNSLCEHITAVAKLSGPADFRAVEEVAWPHMERVHSQLSDVDPAARGFWARINPNLCKLAMIFHVSGSPGDLTIQQEDWSRAVLFMDAAASTVRQLASEDIAVTKTEKGLKTIRNLISQNGGIDRSALLKRSHLIARDFNGLLETLEATGEVHKHSKPNSQGPSTTMLYQAAACPICSPTVRQSK